MAPGTTRSISTASTTSTASTSAPHRSPQDRFGSRWLARGDEAVRPDDDTASSPRAAASARASTEAGAAAYTRRILELAPTQRISAVSQR